MRQSLYSDPGMVLRLSAGAFGPEQRPSSLPSFIKLTLWPAEVPQTKRETTKTPASHVSSPSRRWGGQDFRKGDRVLAEEILKGVKDPKDAKGKLLSDWDACWELAPRADGKGKCESKQKRLSDMVKQLRREKSCLRAEPND